MTDDRKRISITEFRELGFIQEINRRLLHPCGLALEVIVEEDGTSTLGGVWDSRDDPEGFYFGELDGAKCTSVYQLLYAKADARHKELGYNTQPSPERNPITETHHPDKLTVEEFINRLTKEEANRNFITNMNNLEMSNKHAEEWIKIYAAWSEMND